jgi:hypothetical protein
MEHAIQHQAKIFPLSVHWKYQTADITHCPVRVTETKQMVLLVNREIEQEWYARSNLMEEDHPNRIIPSEEKPKLRSVNCSNNLGVESNIAGDVIFR